MTIEKPQAQDIFAIANLHKKEIPTGFISSLNIRIIVLLYQTILAHETLFVAKENGRVIGFVSLAYDTKKLYKRFIATHFFRVAPFFIGKIFSYNFLKKIFETLTAPRKTHAPTETTATPELLSIVIDSSEQAKGLGYLLLKRLEEQLKRKNITTYKVVAGANLVAANKFYTKHQFKLVKTTEIHQGDVSNIYEKALDD